MYECFLGASTVSLKVVYLVELKTSSNFENETFMPFQSYTLKIIFRNLPGAPDPDPDSDPGCSTTGARNRLHE